MEIGQDIELNKKIAWVLRFTVTIAFFLTLIGYIYLLASRSTALPMPDVLRRFPPSDWHYSSIPMLLTAIGVLGFIAVPVSRVAYSAAHFSAKKDVIYAFLSFYVLLMVSLGILVGVV